MNELDQIQKELNEIKSRNQKVEDDKAWETSWTRRLLLTLFTYLAIVVYLYFIDIDKPWHSAIVPSIAFMLSTLTVPFFKQLWLKNRC